jgi:hypothetical protein
VSTGGVGRSRGARRSASKARRDDGDDDDHDDDSNDEVDNDDNDDDELPQLPPRFVDPLTDELMRTPVILPSGHRIDATSLSRHMASSLTDPFTGVALTSDADTIVDVTLQAEIRTWIALHPDAADDATTPRDDDASLRRAAGAASAKRARSPSETGFRSAGYRLGTLPS